MTKVKKDNTSPAKGSVLAKSEDGTIQITFSISYSDVTKNRDEALKELGNDLTVPGFRKGNAPISEVSKHLEEHTIIEKTLTRILPKLLADAIAEHKIRPAVYPKFELVSAKENEDWQVRATTCEIPNIDLSGYKEKITGALRAKNIWTPGKDTPEDKAKANPESERIQKEEEVIKTLLSTIKVNLPKILVDDEVNARLSKLLERIEKLGLSLDSYLASIGKNSQDLRAEYEKQAKDAISIDLILTQIAQEEKLEPDQKSMEAALTAGAADPKLIKELDTPERRLIIENILKRRKALDFLLHLA